MSIQVSKASIWRDDPTLFSRLQTAARSEMDKVAQLCHRRFEIMADEPGGKELINLRTSEWADSEAPETKDREETATIHFEQPLAACVQGINEAVPSKTTRPPNRFL